MGKYCCFLHPAIDYSEKSLTDTCPKCGKEYQFPLVEYPKEIIHPTTGVKYSVRKAVGRGFYGATYLCTKSDGIIDDQDTLLKISPVSVYEVFHKDFKADCKLHAQLARRSEHLVPLHTAFQASIPFGDTIIDCYITELEYIEGVTLEEYLKDSHKYIKQKAETVLPGEEKLINETGVTIGEIETVVLDFNSIYMEFPIEEYKSPDEPLWWVYFSQWEDPKVDLFDRENLCLYLNPYYSACPMVGEEIKNFDLLIDILATTYFMILKKIEENPDDMKATQQNLNLETNSICSIMHQFIESCSAPLHFESPEALLKSLHINIRKMLEEGDGQ